MAGPALPPRYGGREAMPVKGFLDRTEDVLLDELLEKLEGTPGVAHELKRSREQITAIARKLLEPELLPLLEWLCDISLRRPMVLPGLGQEATLYCALREGQNQIVFQLLQAIAEGREETGPRREGM
jgi:hypothetical protein